MTQGERDLLDGVISWLSEQVTIPDGAFAKWGDAWLTANDGTCSAITHNTDSVTDVFQLRIGNLFEIHEPCDLILLMELRRCAVVEAAPCSH